MKRITDKDFKYVPAAATDIRKTFERIKREQKEKAKMNNVSTIPFQARKHGR